jgi:hypothetical protein
MHLGRSLEAVFQVASINSRKREKLVFTRCLAFVTLSLATCFRYRMLSLTSKALGQDICCAENFCSGRVEGTQNVKAGSGAQRGTRQKHFKGTTLGHASTHWNTASAVLMGAQIKRKRKKNTGYSLLQLLIQIIYSTNPQKARTLLHQRCVRTLRITMRKLRGVLQL